MKLLYCALGVTMSLAFQSTASVANKKLDQLNVRLRPAEKPPFDRGSSADSLYATIAPILGQLVYTTSSYDLEPGLLESFQWDYKRAAYILKIKKGLKFHNGRTVTAKDLEFSLLRGFYSGKPSFFLSFLDNIEGVEAIKGDKKFESGKVSGIKILDAHTLSVKLIKPNPSFLHSLARSYFSLVPIEAFKSDYETWKTYPVGAGSYKVKDHKENQRILTLERFSSLGPSPSIINMYYGKTDQESDIDIATHGKGKQIIASKKAATLTSIYFNYGSSIASDINFRKAISLTVEREKVVDGFEIYKPATEFLAQHFWGRIKLKESRDIGKAKSLIKKVTGLDLRKEYQIPVFNGGLENSKTEAYAKVLEKQFREVGLKVKFVTSSIKFFPESDKTTLFRLASLGADVADPLVLFGLLRGKSSPMRPHFPVNDKGYEDLFGKALLSDTFDRRVMAVKNLSKYVIDNVWMVPLFEKKLMVSVDPKRVKDVGLQDGGLTFFLERTTLQ